MRTQYNKWKTRRWSCTIREGGGEEKSCMYTESRKETGEEVGKEPAYPLAVSCIRKETGAGEWWYMQRTSVPLG